MKITSLTKEQEALIPVISEKWINYASEKVDKKAAQKSIEDIYELMSRKKPAVYFTDGPIDAFWFSVNLQLGNRSTKKPSVMDKKTEEAMGRARGALYVSQYWSFWAGYYEIGKEIGVKFDQKKYDIFHNFCKEVPLIYVFEDFAVICEKPKISWKIVENDGRKRRILHNSTGPAVEYKDGFKIYCLNNIRVPKWLVMTDAGKIDPKLALTETNVDVQREIIRKVGIERLLKVCESKTLDIFLDNHTNKGNEYKLIEMSVGTNIRRKYLVYKHASLDGIHYAKPVPPETKRAIHARAWIIGTDLKDLEKMSDEEIKAMLPKFVS